MRGAHAPYSETELTFGQSDDRFEVALDESSFDKRQTQVQPVMLLLTSGWSSAVAATIERRVVRIIRLAAHWGCTTGTRSSW